MIRLKTIFLGSLILLLFTLLSVTFFISFKNNQKFIENQLYSASIDTAYAIGISFAALNEKNPLVEQKTIINAIFDSGYYEYIRFNDTSGNLVYMATEPVAVKDVPLWFIHLVPLAIEEATTDVTRAWRKIGTLHIKSHLGYAYFQLYKSFKDFVLTFFVVFILAVGFLLLIVNTILKSLKKIDTQAKAILAQNFIAIDDASHIVEFNTVAASLNNMVKKVKELFESQASLYQAHQRQLYRDEETGLFNKKYLMTKLIELYNDKEQARLNKDLILVSIEELERLKSTKGYNAYKKTLKYMAKSIQGALDTQDLFARISTNEFALLMDNGNVKQHDRKIEALNRIFNLLPEKLIAQSRQGLIHAARTPIASQQNSSELFSKADYSLQQAKITGELGIYNPHENSEEMGGLVLKGKHAWRQTLETILEHDRLRYIQQSVIDTSDNTIFHQELYMRMLDDNGYLHSAEFFLPMAKAMNLLPTIEQKLLQTLFDELESFDRPIAINLSQDFIADGLKTQFLIKKLSMLPKHFNQKLHFELKEHDVIENPALFREFSDVIHLHAQVIGIDHFSGAENIDYIQHIRPSYIKLSSVALLDAGAHTNGSLNSLNIILNLIDAKIIVTSVCTEKEYEDVKTAGYKLMQGHYIDQM